MRDPLLLVISGPAGSGKGTVVQALCRADPSLTLSVSAATRAPRPGEIDGVHYHFITREHFEECIAEGDMLEYTQYCGNYYGTPKSEIRRALDAGQDLILEIEVEGGANVRRAFPDAAVTVMLMPPDAVSLRARLEGRHTETPEVIDRRMARAEEELALAETYDYVVINEDNDIDGTVKKIRAILDAEHMRSRRMAYFTETYFSKKQEIH